MLIYVYIINVTLLILHEIESGYEQEWRILKLPLELTGFLLLHLPIVCLMFYGVIAIYQKTVVGSVLCVVFGIVGIIPFLVHKIFVRRPGHFEKPISQVLIYGNILTGVVLVVLTFLTY